MRFTSGARSPASCLALVAVLLVASLPAQAAVAPTTPPLELIVAPDSFLAELQPLKRWRESQGLRVDIVTISFIEAHQSQIGARDVPEALHDYVAARKVSDPALEYLLLVGDDPVIRPRFLQLANRTEGATMASADRSMTSDYYYAVASNDFFNASDLGDDYPVGDAWFGISDDSWSLTPEIHVGRLPVSNETELNTYLARLLAWEQDPAAAGWMDRALFGLGIASPPGGWTASDRLTDDARAAFGTSMSNALAAGLTNDVVADYPNWPTNYASASDTLNEAELMTRWSGGYAAAVLAARDNPLSGGPPSEYAGDGSTSLFAPIARPAAIDALSAGNRSPIVVGAYGFSANFSLANDSSIERALLAPGGGAVAAVGFTGRTGLNQGPGSTVGGWTLASMFAEELFARPAPLGVLIDRARERFVSSAQAALGGAFDPNSPDLRTAVAGFSLLGDPATQPWLGQPARLQLAGPSAAPPASSVTLDFTVTASGAAVVGATVAALDEVGDLRGVGTTDSSGVARLLVSTAGRATWTIVASAPGYLRGNATVAIDAPATAFVLNPSAGSRVGGTITVTGRAGDSDPSDVVSLVQASINGGAWFAVNGTDSWSFTLDTVPLSNGPNTLEVRAFDGTVWGPGSTISFVVANPHPPTMTSSYTVMLIPEDGYAQLDLQLGSHFLPSGPGATLAVSVGHAEYLAVTLNGTVLNASGLPNYFGPAAIPLTVYDSFGGAITFNLSVMVTPQPDLPVIVVRANTTVIEGSWLTFDISAYDPDGTTPDVSIIDGPANATLTGWLAPRHSQGLYTFVFAASDGVAVTNFFHTVTVLPFNRAPAADLSVPSSGEEGRELVFEVVNVNDADGDRVTVTWNFGDGQSQTGEKATHVYARPGRFFVQVTLSDGQDDRVLSAEVTIDPYTPPGRPSTTVSTLVGLVSIAILVGVALYAVVLYARTRPKPAEEPARSRTKDPATGRSRREREEE